MLIVEYSRDNGAERNNVITMARDGREVVLLPMRHAAHKDFYDRVDQILVTCDLLIFEGIDDKGSLLGWILRGMSAVVPLTRIWLRAQPRQSKYRLEIDRVNPDTTSKQAFEDLKGAFGRQCYLLPVILPLSIASQAIFGPHVPNRVRKNIDSDDDPAEITNPRTYEAFGRRRDLLLCEELTRVDAGEVKRAGVVYGGAHMIAAYNHLVGLGYSVVRTEWVETLKNRFPQNAVADLVFN